MKSNMKMEMSGELNDFVIFLFFLILIVFNYGECILRKFYL